MTCSSFMIALFAFTPGALGCVTAGVGFEGGPPASFLAPFAAAEPLRPGGVAVERFASALPVLAQPDLEVCTLALVDRATTTSRACLSCHDGSMATSMHTGLRPEGGHPVDVSYEQARVRLPSMLRAAGALPETLPLPEGMVTCTTCHDGASDGPQHLAVTTRASALCTSCHPY
jgi:predicted CXXCH cytochrome family protein